MSPELCKTCLKVTLNFGRPPFSYNHIFKRYNSRKMGGKYTLSPLSEVTKSGRDQKPPRKPLPEALKIGWQRLPGELKLFKDEVKHAIEFQPMQESDMKHGDYEVIYKFDKPALVDSWMTTADADNDEGYSSANFTFTKNRTGLFHGHLDHRVPKTGFQKYSGYTNVSAPPPKKSFQRESCYDWSNFNSLMLRVRGDGRPYMIVIGCQFKFDIMWLNRWCYPLCTRGGPYWQTVKIPFSKFYLSHRGRIQDRQEMLPLERVNAFSITCCDEANGPYSLEIDTISLLYDINASKTHYYELYDNPFWEIQN